MQGHVAHYVFTKEETKCFCQVIKGENTTILDSKRKQRKANAIFVKYCCLKF